MKHLNQRRDLVQIAIIKIYCGNSFIASESIRKFHFNVEVYLIVSINYLMVRILRMSCYWISL